MADKKINGSIEITGKLNPNASGYGISIPETNSWSANKTIATTDDIINVSANPSTTTSTLTGITIGNTSYEVANPITITTTSGRESISDGTNTLNFSSNAFNWRLISSAHELDSTL